MKLTVLGCHSPYPPIDGAGPGYLLEHAGTSVLLDCGSGVVAKLGQYLDPAGGELSAVVLSHLHSDHFCDLLVLRYAHMFAMMRKNASPLPVYCPEEPIAERAVIPFRDVLSVHAISDTSRFQLGEMDFSFYRTTHSYPCYAMRIAVGGKSLVYTGDTAWDAGLITFAHRADVLVVETCFLDRDKGQNPALHLSARDGGLLASEAQVGTLVLSHLPPTADGAAFAIEAATVFAGPIVLARSNLRLNI